YSAAFKGVSITLFLSALIVMFGVQEVQAKIISQGEQTSYSSKEVLQHIIGNPVLFIVMITSSLVQLAHFSVQPILSLYVKELHGPVNIAFFSGLAFLLQDSVTYFSRDVGELLGIKSVILKY